MFRTTLAKKRGKGAPKESPQSLPKKPNSKNTSSNRFSNKDKRPRSPSPESSDDSDSNNGEFEVEAILGKKIKDGQVHYRIKWKGYDHRYVTWEPAENVSNAPKLIEAFEKSLLNQNDSEEEEEEVGKRKRQQKNESNDRQGPLLRKRAMEELEPLRRSRRSHGTRSLREKDLLNVGEDEDEEEEEDENEEEEVEFESEEEAEEEDEEGVEEDEEETKEEEKPKRRGRPGNNRKKVKTEIETRKNKIKEENKKVKNSKEIEQIPVVEKRRVGRPKLRIEKEEEEDKQQKEKEEKEIEEEKPVMSTNMEVEEEHDKVEPVIQIEIIEESQKAAQKRNSIDNLDIRKVKEGSLPLLTDLQDKDKEKNVSTNLTEITEPDQVEKFVKPDTINVPTTVTPILELNRANSNTGPKLNTDTKGVEVPKPQTGFQQTVSAFQASKSVTIQKEKPIISTPSDQPITNPIKSPSNAAKSDTNKDLKDMIQPNSAGLNSLLDQSAMLNNPLLAAYGMNNLNSHSLEDETRKQIIFQGFLQISNYMLPQNNPLASLNQSRLRGLQPPFGFNPLHNPFMQTGMNNINNLSNLQSYLAMQNALQGTAGLLPGNMLNPLAGLNPNMAGLLGPAAGINPFARDLLQNPVLSNQLLAKSGLLPPLQNFVNIPKGGQSTPQTGQTNNLGIKTKENEKISHKSGKNRKNSKDDREVIILDDKPPIKPMNKLAEGSGSTWKSQASTMDEIEKIMKLKEGVKENELQKEVAKEKANSVSEKP